MFILSFVKFLLSSSAPLLFVRRIIVIFLYGYPINLESSNDYLDLCVYNLCIWNRRNSLPHFYFSCVLIGEYKTLFSRSRFLNYSFCHLRLTLDSISKTNSYYTLRVYFKKKSRRSITYKIQFKWWIGDTVWLDFIPVLKQCDHVFSWIQWLN